jgi:large subunit ribosomal protein L9
MKVILKEDVYKHGVTGEIVKVADGFARNWLIPKGMAVPASKANLEQMTSLREQAAENRAIYTDKVNAAAQQINGVELVFGVKAGSNNKLYGSITSQMIKDALMEKTGLDINRRRISDRPIREIGRYDVPVRMGDVSPVLKIVVLREEDVNAYLTGQQPAPAEVSAEGAEATGETANEASAPVEQAGEAAESVQEAPAESGEAE